MYLNFYDACMTTTAASHDVTNKPPAGASGYERLGHLMSLMTGDEKHSTAAVYEYWPAVKPGPARADVWHSSRIVAQGLHIEHWLDGRKVVDIRIDTPEVQQAFASSRRRGSSPVLARHERRSSPVALQFHDGTVWFRNIRLRRLAVQ